MDQPKKCNRRIATFLAFSLCFAGASLANEQLDSEADPLLNDLLNELEQVTQIATHTKLNIDYVPGMVTVLEGKEMLRRGIRTVSEALETVPGIEITLSNEGQNHYVLRGIGKSFSSGKIKMLLNGRAQNAALSAASTIALIPMSMIDRIEIIRGPGSAIYGEYAYAGVMNVILRKNSHLFYTGSQHQNHAAGIGISNHHTFQPVQYAFNLSGFQIEGGQVNAGNDFLKDLSGPPSAPLLNAISNSPGKLNDIERSLNSTLQVSYKNIRWDSSAILQNMGDYFGFANALPSEQKYVRTVATASSDIDVDFDISENFKIRTMLGARYYLLNSELHEFFPVGFPNGPGDTFEDGVLGSPNYEEYEGRGNIEFNYTGLNNHDILFGGHAALVMQADTYAERNHNVTQSGISETTLQRFTGDQNWLTENNQRLLVSMYAQDQWQIWKPFTLTIGGRVDHYFDSGTSVNPRVAGVYNFLDHHIFKAQYARAFRPPTFIEMFARNNTIAIGNADINAETIDSIEFGYIFNNIDTVIRTTAFYTMMDELIVNDDSTGKYQNRDSVRTQGIELEFSQQLFGSVVFSANGTYLNVYDSETESALPNIASLLGNANLSYKPIKDITFNFSGQHIGSREREQGDNRSALPAYQLYNLALSWENLGIKNLNGRLGVKNLLDYKLRHPSPLISFGTQQLPSYAEDYPRPGRELWLNFSYSL